MTSVPPKARTNSTQSVALAPPKTVLMTSHDHGRRDGGVSSHDFVRGCPAQAAVQVFFFSLLLTFSRAQTHGLAACISMFARRLQRCKAIPLFRRKFATCRLEWTCFGNTIKCVDTKKSLRRSVSHRRYAAPLSRPPPTAGCVL